MSQNVLEMSTLLIQRIKSCNAFNAMYVDTVDTNDALNAMYVDTVNTGLNYTVYYSTKSSSYNSF